MPKMIKIGMNPHLSNVCKDSENPPDDSTPKLNLRRLDESFKKK